MRLNAMLAIGAGAMLALTLGPSALTQNTPPQTAPTPTEVALTPTRADNAALAAARQDPLAARVQAVLKQDPATAAVLGQIANSEVPVLAPADPALLHTARFYDGERFYMLTVQRGDQIIEIYGATKAFRPAQQPAAATAPSPLTAGVRNRLPAARLDPRVAAVARQNAAPGLTNLRTEQTEYGTDVTFDRFGAAYNVSFICEGQGAEGCSPAEAAAFAMSLRLVGGGA